MAIRGDTCWIDAVLVRETERALLLCVDGTEHWIPRSQCGGRLADGRKLRIEISCWIAVKSGIVDNNTAHDGERGDDYRDAYCDDEGPQFGEAFDQSMSV